ncbi:B3 domain-containing protein At2g33720-like [Prosopis cineraria]|uniref:B3 domain-containing protein At2g33720-like n=1 Tax=Prosopis cineraria TaxID=364024 RepID=UPI00240FEC1C|nr:B3 domain-containing protein At2g33720-like [Prosopis cineraria]
MISSVRKRVHCFEREEIDSTPWGCSTLLKIYDDPWKIKKVLTATDVLRHHNRLLLASDMVQNLVCTVLTDEESFKLDAGDGAEIKLWDVDTMSLHCLVLKKWASSGSFVLIGKWNEDFLKRRNLKKGDEIGLQWDKFNHRFNISVLHRAMP